MFALVPAIDGGGWVWAAILLAIGFLLCCGLVRLLIPILIRWQIVDRPKLRGLHDRVVPRGGGMAVVVVVSVAAIVVLWPFGTDRADAALPVILLGLPLAGLHFMDDRRAMAVRWRFAAQIAIVVCCLFAGVVRTSPTGGLIPSWLEWPLIALAWLWFMNAVNFLDGSDGYAGTHSAVIAGTVALIAVYYGFAHPVGYIAALLCGACLGFLWWNRAPASIFLGDSGAVWLGFILGWLLLDLGGAGYRSGALILSAWIAADAAVTLLWRVCLGANPWQAHGNHFAQRAIRGGWSHNQLLLYSLVFAVLLGALAVISPYAGWQCVVIAALVTMAGLVGFECRARVGGASLVAMEERLRDKEQ